MWIPNSPQPESFASEKERDFWHQAQDIAFRAGKALILRDGATWLVSPGEESMVCSPQNPESVWWETCMVLNREFPQLARNFVKGRATTKPGQMDQWKRKWPHETEEVLKQHPSVHDCAVLGIGENCIAFVELSPAAQFDAFALIAHCRRHTSALKTPQRIRVMAQLPRHSDGKIDYEELETMM